MNVKETHWAEGDRRAFAKIAEALPAVLDTHFLEWQERVDRSPNNSDADGWKWTHLIVASAIEYGPHPSRPNCSAPVDGVPRRTYLIATDNPAKVHDIIIAHLRVQAPDKSFAVCTGHGSTMVLHAPKKEG